jgi:hypothetical protein
MDHNFSDGIGEVGVVRSLFAGSSQWPKSRKNWQEFGKSTIWGNLEMFGLSKYFGFAGVLTRKLLYLDKE